MATKSILKNVNIRGKRRVNPFVIALEHTMQQPEKEDLLQSPVEEIHTGKIKSFLENYAR